MSRSIFLHISKAEGLKGNLPPFCKRVTFFKFPSDKVCTPKGKTLLPSEILFFWNNDKLIKDAADTRSWRLCTAASTSRQCHEVASMTMRRCINVMRPLRKWKQFSYSLLSFKCIYFQYLKIHISLIMIMSYPLQVRRMNTPESFALCKEKWS